MFGVQASKRPRYPDESSRQKDGGKVDNQTRGTHFQMVFSASRADGGLKFKTERSNPSKRGHRAEDNQQGSGIGGVHNGVQTGLEFLLLGWSGTFKEKREQEFG